MLFRRLIKITVLIILLFIIFIVIKGISVNRSMAQLVDDLNEYAHNNSVRTFKHHELAGLPAPVQRYLKKVIPEGHPYIRFVKLKQTGFLCMEEDSQKWLPLSALQHFTTDPPGFIWDAKIQSAPLFTVRVLDMYKGGAGSLKAILLNSFTVADESGKKELDTGELVRYLAESVWFPTALLPDKYLTWKAIDNKTAMALLRDGDTEVSIKFYFNDQDEIYKSGSIRYKMVKDHFEALPWSGFYSNYSRVNGILIPLKAKVQWDMPRGAYIYWKGKIDSIKYKY